ncbi:hypothetical protein FHS27_001528 [Rhodopirellula rubra]|uniref:Uncharacterized protein n=1 Tax=Aporhodopirellula rubra TaxID=980271 RepID=A0A7W5DWA1_9BACT|nr:hypothetical protein [Aporhodopirellula rubra]
MTTPRLGSPTEFVVGFIGRSSNAVVTATSTPRRNIVRTPSNDEMPDSRQNLGHYRQRTFFIQRRDDYDDQIEI